MTFDVKKHLIKVQGGKEYLPVAQRLVWFREEHPDWSIVTEPVMIDTEKGHAIFKATVYTSEGKAVGSGTKMETSRGFPDFVEKAETGSIGRALAVCGYGTQFAPELEEGERIVDSPQHTKFTCSTCKRDVPLAVARKSAEHFNGAIYCVECGKAARGNGKPEPDYDGDATAKPLLEMPTDQESATRTELAAVITKLFGDKTKFNTPVHGMNWLQKHYGLSISDLLKQSADMLLTIKEAAENHTLRGGASRGASPAL